MSDELVERLAVVICESDTVQPMGWEDVTAHWQDNYRTQARAVVDALGLTEEWGSKAAGQLPLGVRGVENRRRESIS